MSVKKVLKIKDIQVSVKIVVMKDNSQMNLEIVIFKVWFQEILVKQLVQIEPKKVLAK